MFCYGFWLVIVGFVSGNALSVADPVKLPSEQQYSKPTEEDFQKIESWMLELEVFYHRQNAWMYCAEGSVAKTNRRTKEGESHWVNFFASENKEGTKRHRVEVVNMDPTPKLETYLNGTFVVQGGGPEYMVDYIATAKGNWAVDELEGSNNVKELRPGEDLYERDFYRFGGFDPMVGILQVAANGRTLATPSQAYPRKRLQNVADINGYIFGRWVTPMPRSNNKVFFRSTVVFKNEFPVLVINELGKGSEEQFVPYYTLGSVETEWKKISDEDTVPIRVIRRIEVNPKDRNSDIEDCHSDFRLRWLLGADVPKVIFDKQSLGDLPIDAFFPGEK